MSTPSEQIGACPDGGACVRPLACETTTARSCFRVRTSIPRPGVYPEDRWPVSLWAAHVLAVSPPDPDVPDAVEDVARAILEALGPSPREDRVVADWPADERDLYRDGGWRDFSERTDRLHALRARKAAMAAVSALTRTPEQPGENGEGDECDEGARR